MSHWKKLFSDSERKSPTLRLFCEINGRFIRDLRLINIQTHFLVNKIVKKLPRVPLSYHTV